MSSIRFHTTRSSMHTLGHTGKVNTHKILSNKSVIKYNPKLQDGALLLFSHIRVIQSISSQKTRMITRAT